MNHEKYSEGVSSGITSTLAVIGSNAKVAAGIVVTIWLITLLASFFN